MAKEEARGPDQQAAPPSRELAEVEGPAGHVEPVPAPPRRRPHDQAYVTIRTNKPEKHIDAPERPSLLSGNAPPVLVKSPPPLSIRLSQSLWVSSFVVGVVLIVYFFVIREDQLQPIMDVVREVDPERSDDAYERAANIIFWSVFGSLIALLLAQITLLISFMNRKPGVRWWQFFTLILQGLLLALASELVGAGDSGELLRQIHVLQLLLVLLALLASNVAGGVAWSARRHDVRRGLVGSG